MRKPDLPQGIGKRKEICIRIFEDRGVIKQSVLVCDGKKVKGYIKPFTNITE